VKGKDGRKEENLGIQGAFARRTQKGKQKRKGKEGIGKGAGQVEVVEGGQKKEGQRVKAMETVHKRKGKKRGVGGKD